MTKKGKAVSAKKRLSYETKKRRIGLLFVAPWMVGTLFFFLRPFIQSVMYSFSKITYVDGGYRLDFVGLQLYKSILTMDKEYVPRLASSFQNMLLQVPIVVVFSLFVALLLNQKFHGRTVFRGIFFLPVIIANGIILSIINGDAFAQSVMQNASSSQLFEVDFLQSMLRESGVGTDVVQFLSKAADSIFELIWQSGIPILIFISAFQSIPQPMYEAAKMEGATGWECFWKVTFPLLSPMLLLNVIYAMIDALTSYTNDIMWYANGYAVRMELEASSAMVMLYFVFVAAAISIVYVLINRKVFYEL